MKSGPVVDFGPKLTHEAFSGPFVLKNPPKRGPKAEFLGFLKNAFSTVKALRMALEHIRKVPSDQQDLTNLNPEFGEDCVTYANVAFCSVSRTSPFF